MPKLNKSGLLSQLEWSSAQVTMPVFDIDQVWENTLSRPTWIHFGAGNIFRGFMANLQQRLLDQKLTDTGIIAVESFDHDIISQIYAPHDNLSLLVNLNPDGSTNKKVIASIAESISAHNASQPRLQEIFCTSSLQMVSFTITEKGYALTNANGQLLPIVTADLDNGPSQATHIMSIITALLHTRYQHGKFPLALVSMDNCSHNGEKLSTAILTIANAWQQAGFVDAGFVEYLTDDTQITFPWTMVDKITPRPDTTIQQTLSELGFEDFAPIVTSKNTFIAPFVNAEVPEYLVIEDKFPNGRPALENAGVYFTDRETVNNAERMKVTTCLNPLHTALAIFGCLLGYTSIAAEMHDPELKLLVERIGYEEGMPVVVDPKILSPRAFIDEVINQRFANPFIPDTPQRIATDTSQKIVIRFGETLKSYQTSEHLDVKSLTCIPLVIAAWFRYLLSVDDKLQPMQCSSDPLLNELQQQLQGIKVGNPNSYTGQLKNILRNKNIFAIDLVDAGLDISIESMFCEMLIGSDAVRKTLKKFLKI